MLRRLRAFILATLLPLTSCAGSLDMKLLEKPNLEPPRHAYINLTKRTNYRACLNRQEYVSFMEEMFGLTAPPEVKNNPDPLMCNEVSDGRTASGVHIEKHISMRTGKSASVVLTANHFCGGDIKDPEEILEAEVMPFLEEFTVERVYVIKDFRGKEYEVTSPEPLAANNDSDTCLLETERIPHKVLPIAQKELKYGERVMNVSTPYNRYMPPNIILNEGFFIGDHVNGHIMISDMDIGPGSSGSMVVVRRQNRWELVGMIFAISLVYDEPVGVRTPYFEVGETILALAASAKQIEELLKEKDAKG